jgi:hypothetical protein
VTSFPEDIACRDVVEHVSDYLEDALDPGLREALELHLAFCDPCDRYVEQVRAGIRLTGRLGETPLPAGLEARLLDALRQGHEP